MKLMPRHRNHRSKRPRIAITEAEISADLHYPANAAGVPRSATRPRGMR